MEKKESISPLKKYKDTETLGMKKWENGSLIIITWQSRWKKNNGTYIVLISNYVSDIAYEAWSTG